MPVEFEKLLPPAKEFLKIFLSAGPKQPTDIDDVLLGHTDFQVLAQGHPFKTPFSVGLKELIDEGAVEFYRDKNRQCWYRLVERA